MLKAALLTLLVAVALALAYAAFARDTPTYTPPGEPMPVILGGQACVPVYRARDVDVPPSACIPPGDMVLVWVRPVDDMYLVNWRGCVGWIALDAPSWAGIAT